MDLPDLDKMQQMLAQAQQMQSVMDERLAATIVEADSGGGAVKVRMNAKKELLSLTISPSAAQTTTSTSSGVDDLTLLEDLIVAAVNSAGRKADAASNSNAASMLGDLGLPGL